MTRFVEALIEVKRSDCKVTNAVYSVSPGISVKRLRIGSERSLHIVSCRGHMDEVKEEACKIKGANVWSSGKDLLMVDAPQLLRLQGSVRDRRRGHCEQERGGAAPYSVQVPLPLELTHEERHKDPCG
ncbi:hypothetical protein [Thermogymnomonas acidicola]|uniref:hypothetical protein n=1 Tax=Thermogymnomonas acidicola TaxID=399579 RepID=UPI0009462BB2|nr:hypothetical protein [Thermogymnomonas acidicola]